MKDSPRRMKENMNQITKKQCAEHCATAQLPNVGCRWRTRQSVQKVWFPIL